MPRGWDPKTLEALSNIRHERRKKRNKRMKLLQQNRVSNSNVESRTKRFRRSGPRPHKKIENKPQDVTQTGKTEGDSENSENLYSNERTKTEKRKRNLDSNERNSTPCSLKRSRTEITKISPPLDKVRSPSQMPPSQMRRLDENERSTLSLKVQMRSLDTNEEAAVHNALYSSAHL